MLQKLVILTMLACLVFAIYTAMLPNPEAPSKYQGAPQYMEEPIEEEPHPGIFGHGEKFDTPGRLQGRLQVQEILGPTEMMVYYVHADRLLILGGVDTAGVKEGQELQMEGRWNTREDKTA